MSRLDAAALLLEAMKLSQPEEYDRAKRELLAQLGYADIQDAVDDFVDLLMGTHEVEKRRLH